MFLVNTGNTSSGLSWSSLGEVKIVSSSPVDGTVIGSIQQTTKKEYDDIVQSANEAFRCGEWCPPQKEERLLGSLVMN